MSSAFHWLGPNMLSYRWIEPNPLQMKSDPASRMGRVRDTRRRSDSDISESLPEHDSMPRAITITFSHISSRTPRGTEETMLAPSMPPFWTPCEPRARASDTQRDSR